MEDVLVPILVPLITFSMPVLLCWVYYRNEMHTTSQRTEIVKAVIEKNPDLDVEALLQKMNPKQKLLKEKLLSRLLWGCITGFIGLGLLIGSQLHPFGHFARWSSLFLHQSAPHLSRPALHPALAQGTQGIYLLLLLSSQHPAHSQRGTELCLYGEHARAGSFAHVAVLWRG